MSDLARIPAHRARHRLRVRAGRQRPGGHLPGDPGGELRAGRVRRGRRDAHASTLLAAGLPHGVARAGRGRGRGRRRPAGRPRRDRPARHDPRAALIVTLGLGVFAYAVEVLVWGDQPRSFAGLPGAVTIGGARIQAHYLLIIGVTLPVFAALALFFAPHRPGQGADRVRVEPVRGPGGRHRRTPDGPAGVRARRRARRPGRRAGHAGAAGHLRQRRDADRQRVRGRDPRRADPARRSPSPAGCCSASRRRWSRATAAARTRRRSRCC